MRRFSFRRCCQLLMVALVGATPTVFASGCLQTHNERQAFLDAAWVAPWAAVPGSPAYPGAFISGVLSRQINPDGDADGAPDDPALQQVLNTLWATVSTVIGSQIDVNNPYGWADLGRPR